VQQQYAGTITDTNYSGTSSGNAMMMGNMIYGSGTTSGTANTSTTLRLDASFARAGISADSDIQPDHTHPLDPAKLVEARMLGDSTRSALGIRCLLQKLWAGGHHAFSVSCDHCYRSLLSRARRVRNHVDARLC
jgi:hypothetical protein